jgi:hypothetical protein
MVCRLWQDAVKYPTNCSKGRADNRLPVDYKDGGFAPICWAAVSAARFRCICQCQALVEGSCIQAHLGAAQVSLLKAPGFTSLLIEEQVVVLPELSWSPALEASARLILPKNAKCQ